MSHPLGTATVEGSLGCKAPISIMESLTALRSCNSRHLPDFFLMTNIDVFYGLLLSSIWPLSS